MATRALRPCIDSLQLLNLCRFPAILVETGYYKGIAVEKHHLIR